MERGATPRYPQVVALALALIWVASANWSCGARRVLSGTDGASEGGAGVVTDGGTIAPIPGRGLTLRGTICTPPEPKIVRPIKVALLIDTSQSMNSSDPAAQRHKAAEQLVNLWSQQPHVSFLIIAFNSGVVSNGVAPASAEFTNSFSKVTKGLKTLLKTSGGSDIHGALATARKAVLTDLQQQAAFDRALTRYHVVLLTNGMPYPSCGAGCAAPTDFSAVICNKPRSAWCSLLKLSGDACAAQQLWFPELKPCQAYNTAATVLDEVATLKTQAAGLGAGKLQVHARMLATSTTPTWQADAMRALLKKLSKVGGGDFKELSIAAAISFTDLEMKSVPNPYSYGIHNLIASNMNARLRQGQLLPDSDADGLTDAEESSAPAMGPLPTRADSDDDGYSDLLELRLVNKGYHPVDPNQPKQTCSSTGRIDLDGDGLNGCEEAALGSDPKLHDSDRDRIPDLLEHLAGTRPDLADGKLDPDKDGMNSSAEIRVHTDPLVDDPAAKSWRYIYDVREEPVTPDGKHCYSFGVLRVRTVQLAASAKTKTNLVLVYFGLGWSDPADHGVVKGACVRVAHPVTLDQQVTLKDTDFFMLEKLKALMDSPVHDPCVEP